MMPWLLAAPKINFDPRQGVGLMSHLETENGRRHPRRQQKAPLNTHRISLVRASEAPSSDGGVSLPMLDNTSVQRKLREERKRDLQVFLKTQAEREKLTKRLPASSCTPMKAQHLNILDNSSKAWLPSLTPNAGPEEKPTPSRRHISTQTEPMDLENHPQQTCVCGRRVPSLGAAATRAGGPGKIATPGVPATYWTPDDAADYVYGARSPVELHLPDIEGRFVRTDDLSGSDGRFGNVVDPSQRTPRLKSRDHLEPTPQRGASPLALMKPHRDKQSRESQQSYQETLRHQIREKEEQKKREKEKMKDEMVTYDPWGRGGCGAPNTVHKGDVFGFSNEPSQKKNKYQQVLKQQIEEKRRMKEEETERLRIEEEKEEKRLVVERARIQREYEQEKQKALKKAELRSQQNQNPTIPSKTPRRELQKRKRWGKTCEEVRQSIAKEQPQFDCSERGPSPAVPAVQKKLAGGVEFKTSCLESQLSSGTERFVSTPQRRAKSAGASQTQVGQQEMVRVLPNLRNSSKDEKRLELQQGQRSPEGPPQTGPTRERKEQEKEKMEDEMSSYQQVLKQQIEEKRRMKEEETERLRIEEEKEEKRLVVERARIQREYEQEKQKALKKTELRSQQNQNPTIPSKTPRRELQKRKRWGKTSEEVHQSIANQQTQFDCSERRPSPPVPAVQKKLAGGVEFKTSCLESQQHGRLQATKPRPGSSDAVEHREAKKRVHFPPNLEPLHCRSPRMSKSHQPS